MFYFRQILLGTAVLFGVVDASLARDVETTHVDQVSEKWLGRVRADLMKVEGDEQVSAARFAVLAVAASGKADRAKGMVRTFLPSEERPSALVWIASAQSSRDQLPEALQTAAELTTKSVRENALTLIAVRQAQRGDIEDAKTILAKITQEYSRDRALSAIAEAQAAAGDSDVARATVKRIADGEMRERAQMKIVQTKADPIRKMRSGWFRRQINAMLAFSGREQQEDAIAAIAAIAAAQSDNEVALSKHMKAALVNSENSIPLERATTRTLLALALVEAGRDEQAKQMIESAREAGQGEWLGVSNLFGSPVLVHLLIRLDMKDELRELMNSLREGGTIAGQIPFHANLQAVGATYAQLNRLEEAEEYYRQLETSLERVHLGVGVVTGLGLSR